VIDITDSGYYSMSNLESALDWIHEFNTKSNDDRYDMDIVSISLLTYLYDEDLESSIKNLIDQGCIIVASSGNDDKNKIAYPAAFDGVIAVGAIFDDPDGYLTDGTRFDTAYTGHRVTKSITSYYRGNAAWGSNYGSNLDFVAPGFDIEAISYRNEGYQGSSSDIRYVIVDGTSYAAPIIAGVAALVWYTYYKVLDRFPTPDEVYDALKYTAENDPSDPEKVPIPILNGERYSYIIHQVYVGYGVVDAYDAVRMYYGSPTGSSGSSGSTIF